MECWWGAWGATWKYGSSMEWKKKTPRWINMWIETKDSWQWIHQLTWLAQHFESLQNDCGILFNPALRKQMEKKHFFSSTFSLLFPEKKNFPLNVNFHSIACSDNHNFDYRQLIARRWIALHLIHPNLTTVLSWNFTNFSLNRLPPDCNKNMNWESFFFVDSVAEKSIFQREIGASSDERRRCARTCPTRVECCLFCCQTECFLGFVFVNIAAQ